MYGYVPGLVKVTRNRVTPGGACANPVRSCGAGAMRPECTLSAGEVMTAWRAPSVSENNNTLGDADGGVSGVTIGGSWPNVMVWPLTSELAHSTVSPAWIVTLGRMKRISDTDCKPPVVETSSPVPVTISWLCTWSFGPPASWGASSPNFLH